MADGDVSFTKRFRRGQVLFGKRRAYQRKVAIAEFDGICSSDILTFEPKNDDLVLELLPFVVQSEGYFEHALGTSSGSLSPRTRWSQLQDYEFPLPPKHEQRKIAEILWAADEVVESVSKAIDAATDVYSGLVARAFSNGLAGERSIASELGPIPEKWQVASLASLCDQNAPIGYGIVQPGIYDEQGIPTLSIKDLHGDQFTGVHKSSRSIEQQYARSRVQGGDLLLSIKATVGEVALVANGFKGNISRDLARIRPGDNILSRFLLHLLRSIRYQAYIHRFVVGSTRKEISIHYLRKFVIPFPDLAEQKDIVKILDDAESGIMRLQSHNKVLTSLRKGLVNNLLWQGLRRVY